MYSLFFHEKKQHGTLEFPAEYHYVDPSHTQYNMPFHWHKEWEIIRILKGSFLLHADETEINAEEGDILLIRGGMFHGGTPRDCIYECFLFDLHGLFRNLDTVKKNLRPIYRQNILPRLCYCVKKDPEIASAVSELLAAHSSQNTELYELFTIACLSRLFAWILEKGDYMQNSAVPSASGHRIEQVKSVMEYIENHYSSSISLDTLAQVAGMNSKYFCRFFGSITHQTPMDYVNYYRIEQAAARLCATDLSVTQIGMECGFNDSSYFVKAFKKYKNMTPNQYRRQNQ